MNHQLTNNNLFTACLFRHSILRWCSPLAGDSNTHEHIVVAAVFFCCSYWNGGFLFQARGDILHVFHWHLLTFRLLVPFSNKLNRNSYINAESWRLDCTVKFLRKQIGVNLWEKTCEAKWSKRTSNICSDTESKTWNDGNQNAAYLLESMILKIYSKSLLEWTLRYSSHAKLYYTWNLPTTVARKWGEVAPSDWHINCPPIGPSK